MTAAVKTNVNVGQLSPKNKTWLELVRHVKQADLSDIFKLPHEAIYREFQQNRLLERMSAMRADYADTDRGFKVDRPAGGAGTPYVPSKGWYSVSMFNNDQKSTTTSITGVSELTGKEFRSVTKLFQKHSWTDVADNLPTLKAWIENHIMPYMYVGFVNVLYLEPGGLIPPHQDRPVEVDDSRDLYGAYNIINSFNFSIFEKPGATFIHCDRRLDFKSGKCYWLNLNEVHSLVNFSSEGRIHMTIQAIYKPNFKRLISRNLEKIDHWPEYHTFVK